jgi:hypothetical protein
VLDRRGCRTRRDDHRKSAVLDRKLPAASKPRELCGLADVVVAFRVSESIERAILFVIPLWWSMVTPGWTLPGPTCAPGASSSSTRGRRCIGPIDRSNRPTACWTVTIFKAVEPGIAGASPRGHFGARRPDRSGPGDTGSIVRFATDRRRSSRGCPLSSRVPALVDPPDGHGD